MHSQVKHLKMRDILYVKHRASYLMIEFCKYSGGRWNKLEHGATSVVLLGACIVKTKQDFGAG